LLRTIESLPVAPAGAPGCSRDSPTEAVFLSRTRLNKPGSEKETWHVEIDLAESRRFAAHKSTVCTKNQHVAHFFALHNDFAARRLLLHH